MNSFSFSPSDISYLRTALPHCEEAFFAWLEQLDCRNVRLYALEEGSLCFPRVPLIRVEVRTAVVEVCGGGDALRSVRVGHATACDWGCLAVAQPSRLTLAPASCSAAAFVLCLFLGSREVRNGGHLCFYRGSRCKQGFASSTGDAAGQWNGSEEHGKQAFGKQAFVSSGHACVYPLIVHTRYTRTPTSRPHTHHKSHTCTYPTPRLVPPVSLAASHLVGACFVPLAVCRASSTETGPACSGAASGNAVAEPHQLPVADRHERCETESGGWRRQDAARVRAAAGTGARERGARGEFAGARDGVFDGQRQVLLVVFVLCVLCICVCVCTCVSLARLGIFAAGRAVVKKTYIVVFIWERPDGVI